MILISWSRAVSKAQRCGAKVREITDCGNLVGLEINGQTVRPDVAGWYEATKIDAAIGPKNIPVSLNSKF